MKTLMCLYSLAAVAALARTPLVPLLWTQGQPPETIRKVVREVAEGGNTGFVWESRPHPDYLGPRWWSDLRVAVDEAKKLGLEVWIFDEEMYPSGIAGGRVVGQNPEFSNHVVVDRAAWVKGPALVEPGKVPGGLLPSEKVLSVVALRKGREPVNLTGKPSWQAGEGDWRVVWCVTRPLRPRPGWSMDNMVDVLNPEATAAFLKITHEPTYEHFKEDFGKTIKGFFSDETGFRNIKSYDSLPGTPGMPMPWSPTFAAYFQKLKGYDPAPLLASLWYDLGPRGRAARFDLMDAYSRRFAEAFFRPQQEWCRRHGVKFIGHVVEDNHADHQLGYGAGHWFRVMQYFDVPGIDIVGYQVTPGMDSGGNHWTAGGSTLWDQEFFQFELPAMARGAALIKGGGEIFSEAFGANGWSEGLRMQKWIGDWHIVNGIGFLSPHAVTMKHHDSDCPPHFNATSGNPQARYYRTWSGYFGRLQKLLEASQPVYDAAVLYTAESRWTGAAQTAGPVVRALENRQVSTVVLPYETLAEGTVEGGQWVYHGQRFSAIVLPYVQYAPAPAVKRLAELAQAGVRVIAIDRWPEGSVDGRGDDAVKAAVEQLRGSPAASVMAVGELNLGGNRIDTASPHLFVSHRKTADGEWLLLHNRSLTNPVRGRLPAAVARYDAERDTYIKISGEVEIPPYGLWCVKISGSAPRAEIQSRFASATPFPGSWTPAVGDWRRTAGREKFAGTVTYRATVEGGSGPLALDLGEVGEIAELRVNGKPAGVRIVPPYRFDLTGLLKPGKNTLELDVTNTAQAMWEDSFSHGDAVSGLLGPVRILR